MKTGTKREVTRRWIVLHGMKPLKKRKSKVCNTEQEAAEWFAKYDAMGRYVDVFTEVVETITYVEKLS